jgi:hypothetical protein
MKDISKTSDVTATTSVSGFELFFGSKSINKKEEKNDLDDDKDQEFENINLQKYQLSDSDFEIKSNLTNYDTIIDPLKDAKINKLKSSVDNLRRELQLEANSEDQILNRIQLTKRKLGI